tara:strand:- start:336 stop:530 length:195 start_codon:yes stop_codon:yes gene_type:complete
VTSYWIEGEMGETIKTKEFKSISKAEYYNKENKLNPICSYSSISDLVPKKVIMAKIDCTYCNAV